MNRYEIKRLSSEIFVITLVSLNFYYYMVGSTSELLTQVTHSMVIEILLDPVLQRFKHFLVFSCLGFLFFFYRDVKNSSLKCAGF